MGCFICLEKLCCYSGVGSPHRRAFPRLVEIVLAVGRVVVVVVLALAVVVVLPAFALALALAALAVGTCLGLWVVLGAPPAPRACA